jgi:hypothetical protein
MSAPDNTSYFSRFFLKFIEIIAAGLATAASGYLIAHLSGALSSPAPAPATAVIRAAPSASTLLNLSTTPNTPSGSALSSAPAQSIAPSAPPPSSSPTTANISGTADEAPVPSQKQINAPPAPQPARKTANTKPDPAPKRIENAATAAPDSREQGSFVSRVKAALKKGETGRVEPVIPPQPAPDTGIDRAPAVLGSTAPSAAAAPTSPLQGPPVDPNRPATVEITSRPVVDAQPPTAPVVEQDTGGLSALEKKLRQDPLRMRDDEVPRPPLPVGQ